jgi:predicted phage terminase large subunit-like protein
MMAGTLRAFNAILRTHFGSFVYRSFLTLNPSIPFLSNWHIDALCYELDRIRRGESNRLIINMPPRHLKSIIVSVALPAFLLGHDPSRRIICVSYGNDLSAKHAADFRTIIESDWYIRAFPGTQIARAADSDIFTTRSGYRRSTSVLGPLTGLGGDTIIIDDPQKPIDAQSKALRDGVNQWFSSTLLSRLDNKQDGVIIVVMQRVHQHDLTGHLIENTGDWKVLSLPAIAESDERIPIGDDRFHHRRTGDVLHPEHESRETLKRFERDAGSYVFAAQYQQSPIPPGGAMIRHEWLVYDAAFPEPKDGDRILQSWDTASKDGIHNDWSVCTTWMVTSDKHYYLLDVSRGRYDYPRLRDKAIELAQRFEPTTILVEDAGTGTALAQELRQIGDFRVDDVSVDRDKVTRLYVQAGKFEAGRVHFRKGAPYLVDLETELLSFPQSKHDDQVDSITQALAYEGYGYDTSLSWVG